MEKLLEILSDLHPEVDFEHTDRLFDDHILDSFDIVTLVTEIGDEFDVEIEAPDMIPDNFNSIQAIWGLIQRKQEED